MDTIEQTIRPHGSTTAGRLRIAIVVALLVVGLLAGFGFGRAGGSSGINSGINAGVAPAWPAPFGGSPGHVPRVWVDRP